MTPLKATGSNARTRPSPHQAAAAQPPSDAANRAAAAAASQLVSTAQAERKSSRPTLAQARSLFAQLDPQAQAQYLLEVAMGLGNAEPGGRIYIPAPTSGYKPQANLEVDPPLQLEVEAKVDAMTPEQICKKVALLSKFLTRHCPPLQNLLVVQDKLTLCRILMILIPIRNVKCGSSKEYLNAFFGHECHATRCSKAMKAAYDQFWKQCGISHELKEYLAIVFDTVYQLQHQPLPALTAHNTKGEIEIGKGSEILKCLCGIIQEFSNHFEQCWRENCDTFQDYVQKMQGIQALINLNKKVLKAISSKSALQVTDRDQFCETTLGLLSRLKRCTQDFLPKFGPAVMCLDLRSNAFQTQIENLYSTILTCQMSVSGITKKLLDELTYFVALQSRAHGVCPNSIRFKTGLINLFKNLDHNHRSMAFEFFQSLKRLGNEPDFYQKPIPPGVGEQFFDLLGDIIESEKDSYDISNSKYNKLFAKRLLDKVIAHCKVVIEKTKADLSQIHNANVFRKGSNIIHELIFGDFAKDIRSMKEQYLKFTAQLPPTVRPLWNDILVGLQVIYEKAGFFKVAPHDLSTLEADLKIRRMLFEQGRSAIEADLKSASIEIYTHDQATAELRVFEGYERGCQSTQVSTQMFAQLVTILNSVHKSVTKVEMRVRSAKADAFLLSLAFQTDAAAAKAAEREKKAADDIASARSDKHEAEAKRRADNKKKHQAKGAPLQKTFFIPYALSSAPDWKSRFRTPQEKAFVDMRQALATAYKMDPAAVHVPANMSGMEFTVAEILQRQHLFHTDCSTLAVGLHAQNKIAAHQPFLIGLILRWGQRAAQMKLALQYQLDHPGSILNQSLQTLVHGVKNVPAELSLEELSAFQLYPWNFSPKEGHSPLALRVIRDETTAAQDEFSKTMMTWIERFREFQLPAAEKGALLPPNAIESDSKLAQAVSLQHAEAFSKTQDQLESASKLFSAKLGEKPADKVAKPLSNALYHLRNMQQAIAVAIHNPQQRYLIVMAEALAMSARGVALNIGAYLSATQGDGLGYNLLEQYQQFFNLGTELSPENSRTLGMLNFVEDDVTNLHHYFATQEEPSGVMTVLNDSYSLSMEALFMNGQDGANAAAGKYKDPKTVQGEFATFVKRLAECICALTTLHLK